jgi:hypothetical protein
VSVKPAADSAFVEETRTLKLSKGLLLLERAQKETESPLTTSSFGVINQSLLGWFIGAWDKGL